MIKNRLVPFFIAAFVIFLFSPIGASGTEADAHFEKGVSYINEGDYHEAIEEFNRALTIDSKYVDAYCGIGIAYLNQKKYGEAIQSLQKVIALDSKKAIAYYLLGMAYERVMNYGEAIAAWEKFLALNPEGKRAEKVRKHMKRLEEFKE